MSNWREAQLDQVVELRRGFDLPYRMRSDGPYPVLSAGLVAGNHSEGPVKGPGLVIGRATNLGQPTWCDTDYWPLNTTLYVADFYGNVPRWVYHLFEYVDLTGFDSGSVQPMLNRNYIAQVHVRVPPVDEQVAIAALLGALDDKIVANADLLSTMDHLSRTLYVSMLVEVREIPMTDLASFVNGKAFTKDASGTGRVVIRIAELNSGIGGSTIYNDIEVADDYLARPGDLLFAWSGSLTLHRWYRDEAIINQHIFKVIPKPGYPIWLVSQVLAGKLEEFRAIAADKATTMGHIQRRHLEEAVPVPSVEIVSRHDEAMSAMWARALAAERESLALAELRDTLLPQLMSGRLRVRDAEKQVEAVV